MVQDFLHVVVDVRDERQVSALRIVRLSSLSRPTLFDRETEALGNTIEVTGSLTLQLLCSVLGQDRCCHVTVLLKLASARTPRPNW